jgi:hypothetical protein
MTSSESWAAFDDIQMENLPRSYFDEGQLFSLNLDQREADHDCLVDLL